MLGPVLGHVYGPAHFNPRRHVMTGSVHFMGEETYSDGAGILAKVTPQRV